MLKDDVAAASGDVAVEDRAAVIDLLGDPTDLAGVEVGVAELELDVFALVGEEQHAPPRTTAIITPVMPTRIAERAFICGPRATGMCRLSWRQRG